ncbi:MAG TPA: ABC transporter permease [Longimicrobiaceae bacterium]|nr:ABC transporter permease [Longimicrobiaceae bacterium]
MSEILIVLAREFRERVRTRGFVLTTLLFPVFIGALTLLPAMSGGGGERRLVVVDEAPAGIGEYVVQSLSRPPAEGDRDAYTYHLERVEGPLDAVRGELSRRVLAEEIDGYLYLPAGVVEGNEIELRARNVANFQVERDVRVAVSQAVQAARMREQGLDVTEVSSLLRPVKVQTLRVTQQGDSAESGRSSFLLGYLLGFMVYALVLLYGINVMRSVLEEKTNRIAEVIVSSMKATHLMAGKILGVGAVALLQVSIWGAIAALAVARSGGIANRLGLPADTLGDFRVEPWILASALGFFVLGFLLYAALFAAVGAAVNSEQEAQQFQTVALLPLIAPLLFLRQVITDPLGPTATALGMIPFTAPVTMPMRLAAAAVPDWQVAVSLAGTFLAVLLMAWVAGKIYRIGILSTGKKPTLRELGHWLRAA